MPVFAQAQSERCDCDPCRGAKVLKLSKATKPDRLRYGKAGHELAAADEKTDELNQKMGELQKKLVPNIPR